MHGPELGKLIELDEKLDAVHIAIAPVTAITTLHPGDAVGFLNCQTELVSAAASNLLGIVDPFLKNPVLPGQRFWMFLYPGTITSLRHDWTHPSFPTSPDSAHRERVESEKWLRDYAVRMNTYDVHDGGPLRAFERLIEGLREQSIFANGTDLHGEWELFDADDLRFHAERYLGIKINWGDFTFSCSC